LATPDQPARVRFFARRASAPLRASAVSTLRSAMKLVTTSFTFSLKRTFPAAISRRAVTADLLWLATRGEAAHRALLLRGNRQALTRREIPRAKPQVLREQGRCWWGFVAPRSATRL